MLYTEDTKYSFYNSIGLVHANVCILQPMHMVNKPVRKACEYIFSASSL